MTDTVAHVAYGKGRIPLNLDPALAAWHVIAPKHQPSLPDPHAAFTEACRAPIGSVPLRECIRPGDHVVIVTSDGTRPVPNRDLIPWLLDELPVPPDQMTVLLGTGTHRPNTPGEIDGMFGADVARRVRIVNHDAYDPAENEPVGHTSSGVAVEFNKAYVEADKRIAVGFIEPHFFAGFSGGPKAVAPGIASIETIFRLHSYDLIAHSNSTWGVLDGNPLHETICDMVALCPPDFLVNVTLDADQAITGFVVGDYMTAHRAGCEQVREHAMAPVPHGFALVVTSNSGYPLDQNLYQSVKGMSAAARIVQEGGTILMASECSDGVPDHGNFGAVLREHDSVEAIDAYLRGLSSPALDQWQVQVLVQVRKRCDVVLHSSLDAETVQACKLIPADNLEQALGQRLEALGKGTPVAVLPDGPLTIPYVA